MPQSQPPVPPVSTTRITAVPLLTTTRRTGPIYMGTGAAGGDTWSSTSVATRQVNPFRQRIRGRQRQMGGQHSPSQTDQLSPEMERLIEFEAARAAAVGEEASPW
jgi:hypothetical protein